MTFWRVFTRPPRPLPDDDASMAIARTYRAWARARGHAVSEADGLRIRGAIAGRDALVDPGIDGRAPGWVIVTVQVALPAAESVLVTRASRASNEVTSAIRDLFDDEAIGPDLRAISVASRHVRLRLAPGAPPDAVEAAVGAVARALRTLYASPPSESAA